MTELEPLKYDPGNLGDILKHSWLIEIVSWLEPRTEGPFLYADSFCGCYEYEGLREYVKKRFNTLLRDTALFSLQEKMLRRDAYLGGAAIVQDLLKRSGHEADLQVFDMKEERIASYCSRADFTRLPVDNGYAVLTLDRPFTLIHIDPYDDFIPDYKRHMPAVCSRTESASILVFLIYQAGRPQQYALFLQDLPSLLRGAPALIGRIPAHPFNAAEAKYHCEMLFLPEKKHAAEAVKELFPRLRSLTVRLNTLILSEISVQGFHDNGAI